MRHDRRHQNCEHGKGGVAAAASGVDRDRVRHFANSDEAAKVLAGLVQPGDVVLVKGSRGIRTDRVVERLRAERV